MQRSTYNQAQSKRNTFVVRNVLNINLRSIPQEQNRNPSKEQQNSSRRRNVGILKNKCGIPQKEMQEFLKRNKCRMPQRETQESLKRILEVLPIEEAQESSKRNVEIITWYDYLLKQYYNVTNSDGKVWKLHLGVNIYNLRMKKRSFGNIANICNMFLLQKEEIA